MLGGDCSLPLASGLALASRRSAGLIHIDGHTDFCHPGNCAESASVAGEDLAAPLDQHWPSIADIDGCGAYFSPANTVHIGCRDEDREFDEARSVLGLALPAHDAIDIGMDAVALAGRSSAATVGYWLHVDVDVDILDPTFMPPVDSPDPGGLTPYQLIQLLTALAPWASGAQITLFDSDLDPEGRYAEFLSEIIATSMTNLGAECH